MTKYDNKIVSDHNLIVKIIPSDERRTSRMLDKNEKTRLIQARVQHIKQGGKIYAQDIDDILQTKMATAEEIAEREFYQRRCPLLLRRPVYQVGNTQYVEEWDVKEMIYPGEITDYAAISEITG